MYVTQGKFCWTHRTCAQGGDSKMCDMARGADLNLASERERKVKHSLRIVCLVQIQGR
jgi:hypothetical protein